jgi:dihydrodipicolinate synthase/N-acetylneuraminate lyase
MDDIERVRKRLAEGLAIPACPLALNSRRKPDERRQRALLRYYLAAGAGGLAVGVHTTQFAIHDPKLGLFKPLLELAREELGRSQAWHACVAGICGSTKQATAEAALARQLNCHAGLLSLAGHNNSNEEQLLAHCSAVAEIIPVFGFYLQPAVGGRVLSQGFWRRFGQIENVVAVKIAPFNRYQTLDVIRGITQSGRTDISLYTGNDDNIILDLLTPFHAESSCGMIERRIVGGLLGHWAVWTRKAVELHKECRQIAQANGPVPAELLRRSAEVTDANAAFFDAANQYAGCIPGLHEVLRRQGLLEGTWCLDPKETLSPGQLQEIDRVYRAYPHLNDDAFVAENRDEWLR